MSYSEDLKSPMWQRKRLRVFELAGFHCERCESGDITLHAHHKIYLRGRKPWEYPDHMLECLCEHCHSKAHVEREQLDLVIAQQPTAAVPRLTRLFSKLGVAMASGDRSARAHFMNDMQDEIDALEDFRRGDGSGSGT